MKIFEIFNVAAPSLIGMKISGRVVTTTTRHELWKGDFNCTASRLKSLKGAPSAVENFICDSNELTSLEGAPKFVEYSFLCSSNKLTSLEGCPEKIGSGFNCDNNKLTSLAGAPEKIGGYFICSYNRLTSLKGAPKEVGTYFGCNNNKLTNLKDIHKIVTKMNGAFNCRNNPITSHVLGLLLIDGLDAIVSDTDWGIIVNEYLGKGRKGMLDCQNELIDAGFEEYAQL